MYVSVQAQALKTTDVVQVKLFIKGSENPKLFEATAMGDEFFMMVKQACNEICKADLFQTQLLKGGREHYQADDVEWLD